MYNSIIEENWDLILEKSRKNCHIRGLHSLVLCQREDGGYIRIFYTMSDHEMYNNNALAIHPHHRGLTLKWLWGNPTNYFMEMKERPGGEYSKYKFHSSILNDKGGFVLENEQQYIAVPVVTSHMSAMDNVIGMDSRTLHTMTVPKSTHAAWMVTEHPNECEAYDGRCYSTQDLTKWKDDNLYTPFTEDDIAEFMEMLKGHTNQ